MFKGLRLAGGQLEEVLRQLCVVLAGFGAAAVDARKGDEQHAAVAVGLDGVAEVGVWHGEYLAEDVARAVLLKQRVFAVAVHAVEVRPP